MGQIAPEKDRGTYARGGTLSNVQIELLKLYSTDLEYDDLMELRKVLANYFAQKAMNGADAVWDQKNLSSDTMETWLNEP
jgi:lysyl-tRNA synthetase class II